MPIAHLYHYRVELGRVFCWIQTFLIIILYSFAGNFFKYKTLLLSCKFCTASLSNCKKQEGKYYINISKLQIMGRNVETEQICATQSYITLSLFCCLIQAGNGRNLELRFVFSGNLCMGSYLYLSIAEADMLSIQDRSV